jgi:hypothetical protein
MTSNVKSNKWVSFIKDYASKNGMSYREAMRSEGCKSAYKSPEPERSPSPVRPPSPEPVEVETKPKKGRKKAPLPDLMPVPVLERSEPISEPETLIPTIVKKERKRREPKFVPT